MVIPAHIKYVILTIFFLMASVNFTRTALEIIENSKRLDDLSQEVEVLEEQKTELEESASYKRTDAYIEEKARNDLNLIRPGEKVYVIPKELKEEFSEASVLGEKNRFFDTESNEEASNFSKWWKLFVY